MKKIFFLALLLIVFKAEAQQEGTFKIKYEPGRDYNAVMALDFNCSINATGDSDIIKKITSQGITLPASLVLGGKFNLDTKTGALTADKTIPFTMSFRINIGDIALNGKSVPLPK